MQKTKCLPQVEHFTRDQCEFLFIAVETEIMILKSPYRYSVQNKKYFSNSVVA